MAEVTGPGPAELKLLAARLREADPVLKRELRRNFKAAAAPVAGAVQQSILSMPAKTEHGLRRQVAGTVKLSTSFTKNGVQVTITSDGKRMPPGKQTLPYHLDSARGWNHPVFARGPRFTLRPSRARKYRHLAESARPQVNQGAWTWRHQTGKPGWFERPIALRGREFQAAAQKAIDAVQRELGA